MIGVGDAGGDSGEGVDVGGDGCWRAASGADDDDYVNDGFAYGGRRIVVRLAMLTAAAKVEMMTVG